MSINSGCPNKDKVHYVFCQQLKDLYYDITCCYFIKLNLFLLHAVYKMKNVHVYRIYFLILIIAEKSSQWHSNRLKELSAEMKQERSRSLAAEKGFQVNSDCPIEFTLIF